MLKNLCKKIYYFSINILESIVSLLSIILFSSFKYARRNSMVTCNLDTCYILGNGPSLKVALENNEIDYINKEVYVVNLFCLDEYFGKLKPNNYVIADSGFWKTTSDKRILDIQSVFKERIMKVDWKLNLYTPYEITNKFEDIIISNKYINLIKYNRTPVSGFKSFRHLVYKFNLGMPLPVNVLNVCIFCALNNSYKKILIYGADFSSIETFFVNEKNQIAVRPKHFYDKNNNQVDAIIMKKGAFKNALLSMVKALDSYEKLEDYSISQGKVIINKTRASYIDVFNKE